MFVKCPKVRYLNTKEAYDNFLVLHGRKVILLNVHRQFMVERH
jgi:hypothetical protein